MGLMDGKSMVSCNCNMKRQKRVECNKIVLPLELDEVGMFDQLRMKRDKWEVWTTDHNLAYLL